MFRAALRLHFLPRSCTTTIIASRPFSQTPVTLREWMLIIPDKPGALERRLQIRPTHSKDFRALHQKGHVSWGGPLFTQHVREGQTRPFQGSVLVMNGESKTEVLAKIQSDVYVEWEVWDIQKAQIYPFATKKRVAFPGE